MATAEHTDLIYNLESIYSLPDNEINSYITAKGSSINQNRIINRLAATIHHYNSGTLRSTDRWYVSKQPDFSNLYMTPILNLAKMAEQMQIIMFNGITNLDLIRLILTKKHLNKTSQQNVTTTIGTSLASKNIPKKKKILVVGGGPVGLIFSILIKLDFNLDKLYDITILEKRPTYDRQQIILINSESYNLLPDKVKHEIWLKDGHPGCFILPPTKDPEANCYLQKLDLSSAPIFMIEQELHKYASNLNIDILRPSNSEELFNIDITPEYINLNDQSLDYDIVVGADGANSEVRSKMLETLTKEKFTPLWGLTIIDQLTPQDIGGILDRPTQEYQDLILSRPDQNESRIFRTTYGLLYLAFVITQTEALQVQDYLSSSQNSNNIEWLKDKLQQTCLNIKTHKCPQINPRNTSVFGVKPTYSLKYSKMSQKPIYLIGDALVNTNFFTGSGFNVGLKSAKILVDLLKTYTHGFIPTLKYKKAQQPGVDKIFSKVSGVQQLQGLQIVTFNTSGISETSKSSSSLQLPDI